MRIFYRFTILFPIIFTGAAQGAVFECMDLANSLTIKKYVAAIAKSGEKCIEQYYQKNKKPLNNECDSRAVCTDELLQTETTYLKEKVKVCEGIKKKYSQTDLLTLPPEALVFEGKKPQSVDDVFQLSNGVEIERQELIYLKSMLPRYITDEMDIARFCPNYLTYSPRYSAKKKMMLEIFNKGLKR